jgi:hypothetical protein
MIEGDSLVRWVFEVSVKVLNAVELAHDRVISVRWPITEISTVAGADVDIDRVGQRCKRCVKRIDLLGACRFLEIAGQAVN